MDYLPSQGDLPGQEKNKNKSLLRNDLHSYSYILKIQHQFVASQLTLCFLAIHCHASVQQLLNFSHSHDKLSASSAVFPSHDMQ